MRAHNLKWLSNLKSAVQQTALNFLGPAYSMDPELCRLFAILQQVALDSV